MLWRERPMIFNTEGDRFQYFKDLVKSVKPADSITALNLPQLQAHTLCYIEKEFGGNICFIAFKQSIINGNQTYLILINEGTLYYCTDLARLFYQTS